MKSKFILLTFLACAFCSNAFCMDREDIYSPNVENYNGKTWRLKKPELYAALYQEDGKLKPEVSLVPYHAWIKYEDKDNLPLHVIFYTLGEDKKPKTNVSFVCDNVNGKPVDPTKYRFKRTTDIKYLIKDPYRDDKQDNKITGKKFDAWNLEGTLKKEQKKFWDPMPEGLPVNSFPVIFEYHEGSEK